MCIRVRLCVSLNWHFCINLCSPEGNLSRLFVLSHIGFMVSVLLGLQWHSTCDQRAVVHCTDQAYIDSFQLEMHLKFLPKPQIRALNDLHPTTFQK